MTSFQKDNVVWTEKISTGNLFVQIPYSYVASVCVEGKIEIRSTKSKRETQKAKQIIKERNFMVSSRYSESGGRKGQFNFENCI